VVGSGPKTGMVGKVAGAKASGPGLYMIEPSGLYWVCLSPLDTTSTPVNSAGDGNILPSSRDTTLQAAATGKGRQTANGELERLDLAFGTMPLLDGAKEAAQIIYVAHEDTKDKDFELQITWISLLDGPTKGRHICLCLKKF
jgi:20S proteasome subunit alpha 7